MSTFAPLQFLKSAQNPLVWTAVDNGTDTRTSLIIYYGAANTVPTDTGMYEVNCIMMHQAEKQLYANTGTPTTPTWEAFGPNSAFPQPLVPGSFLFTDGATVYWATQLVGQIQYNASNLNTYGILNFNNLLVASNDVPNSRINVDLDVVALGADATFISTLEGNLDLANIGGAIDLSTQVTGVLNSTNIDITNLESNLDLSQIAGSLDLSTQVTGQLPAANIDITDLESNLTLGNIGGSIDLTTQVTGQLDASNIDVSSLDEQVKVAVDGVTITGDGTTANPLVAVGSGGGASSTITLIAGETINGATNPVPVFMGTNIDVDGIDRLFTDDDWNTSQWDVYQSPKASGSTYTWNQNTKYAYKISGDRVYDIFNLFGLRRQGIQGNNVSYTINIYNTGVTEPTGTPIATRSISTTYPGTGTGSYNQYIALSAEVDCTPVLSGGNNYWLELVIGTITPGASTDIETFNRTLLSGGDYLAWNGSAWVAANVPAVELIGVPNAGYVYRNYGDNGFSSLESLDSPIDQHDVSRGHFVGFVTSNVVKGAPVVVTTDGIVTFTTPFTTSGGSQYVVPDTIIGTVTTVDAFSNPLGSFATPGANTVGLLSTDTDLKIFRNGRNSTDTFYQ